MGENGTMAWPENNVFSWRSDLIRTGPSSSDRWPRLGAAWCGAQPPLLNLPLNGEVSAFDLRVQP